MSYNYLIAINKPQNWTSSDVVIKVRNVLSKALGEKVKIGHMGTLDPMATGVLLLGINKATRLFDYMLSKDKRYIGTLTFGTSTDTLDATGKVVETSSLPTLESIQKVIPNFIGEISQIPPKYSALKINGQKAYDLARKGTEFEIAPRKVKIYNLELVDFSSNKDALEWVKLDVKCSSGTYIRTLFTDIASNAKVCGNMSMLNRIELANVKLENSTSIEKFEQNPLDYFINPLDIIKNLMDVYELSDSEFYDVQRGVGIKLDNNQETLAFTYKNELKFIAKKINGIFKSQTNLE